MAYTDLTTRYTYMKRVNFQDFDDLANNDDYANTHGWPTGTVGVFFQAAAPAGWTKSTAQNDKCLRVVSGTGGGAGGAVAISTGFALAHTHTITSQTTHTHTMPNHEHYMNTQSVTTPTNFGGTHISNDNPSIATDGTPAVADVVLYAYTETDGGGGATSADGAHAHGGTSGSGLATYSPQYVDVIICSKDTSTGYTDLTDTFVSNRSITDEIDDLGPNDEYLKARLTPSGTVLTFYQAAAPTGWTKITTQNDKALRVVSGSGAGTGGTTALSTNITLAHTHTISSESTHTHTIPAHLHNYKATSYDDAGNDYSGTLISGVVSGYCYFHTFVAGVGTSISQIRPFTQTDGGGGTTGSGGSHDHGGVTQSELTSAPFAYCDVLFCSRDSSGSGSSYLDMSSVFLFRRCLYWQRLDQLGENDAYIKFHLIPAGSVAVFFQAAAPSQWIKLTTQTDKMLRVVSGTGGGAGGTILTATGAGSAHTHSIDSAGGHTHSTPNHSHTMDTYSHVVQSYLSPHYAIVNPSGGYLIGEADVGLAIFTRSQIASTTASDGAGTTDTVGAHTHGGATESSGSALVPAYIDVIQCQKT